MVTYFLKPITVYFWLLLCICTDTVDLHINLYRPLSEHLVSMVLSYWRSSVELEDLFSTFMKVTWTHCTVTLGIVVKCFHAATLPDLQASALDLQWYHENRMLRKGSITLFQATPYHDDLFISNLEKQQERERTLILETRNSFSHVNSLATPRLAATVEKCRETQVYKYIHKH